MTLFFQLFDHFSWGQKWVFLANFARIEDRSHPERAGKANRTQQRSEKMRKMAYRLAAGCISQVIYGT